MSIFPEYLVDWQANTEIPNRAKEKTKKYWNKTLKLDLLHV
jgi:hypothetical protein